MQIVQLYIDGQKVEMFSDESIQLTSSIKMSEIYLKYLQTTRRHLIFLHQRLIIKYLNTTIITLFKMVMMQGLEVKQLLN